MNLNQPVKRPNSVVFICDAAMRYTFSQASDADTSKLSLCPRYPYRLSNLFFYSYREQCNRCLASPDREEDAESHIASTPPLNRDLKLLDFVPYGSPKHCLMLHPSIIAKDPEKIKGE